MTRTERLLRLARLRGDRLAIAVLEGHGDAVQGRVQSPGLTACTREQGSRAYFRWSESEMRAAWGDR